MRRMVLCFAAAMALGLSAETTITWTFDASAHPATPAETARASFADAVANWTDAYVDGLLLPPGLLWFIK